MFVRSRPSRTRAERPIPGDRLLDAFDRARRDSAAAGSTSFRRTLGILAVTAAEANPTEGDILGASGGAAGSRG